MACGVNPLILAPEEKCEDTINGQGAECDPTRSLARPSLSNPCEGCRENWDEYEQPKDHSIHIANKPSNINVPTAMEAAYHRTCPDCV